MADWSNSMIGIVFDVRSKRYWTSNDLLELLVAAICAQPYGAVDGCAAKEKEVFVWLVLVRGELLAHSVDTSHFGPHTPLLVLYLVVALCGIRLEPLLRRLEHMWLVALETLCRSRLWVSTSIWRWSKNLVRT